MTAAPLFTRNDPAPVDPARIVIDTKGKPRIHMNVTCGRCGGTGAHSFCQMYGSTCFECGGNGKRVALLRLYTEAQIARLNASAAKRRAAKIAAQDAARAVHGARIAERKAAFLAIHGPLIDTARRIAHNEFVAAMLADVDQRGGLTDGQITGLEGAIARAQAHAAAVAASQHVGTVGERIERAVTVTGRATYQRAVFGSWTGAKETVAIVTMTDADGNQIVSKSPTFDAAIGDAFTLRATIKAHDHFRDVAQTVIQRAKIKPAKEST